MYVLEYSKVCRLDQIVDKIILTSIFKSPGVIGGSWVLLELIPIPLPQGFLHWLLLPTRLLLLLLLLLLLQSCPTLCDPIDGSPPGSPIPGILQARTLEWVAISFSNAWKWKVKMKSLSHVWLFATPWTAAYHAPLSMGVSKQEYWSRVPLPSPAHKTTPYQCRQEPLIPKTEALLGKVPQPLTPVVSKRCWVQFQWGRRVFSVSMQQAVTWALPQTFPHPQPTPGPRETAPSASA